MSEKTDYVRRDEGGVMRVADTQVPLDSVIAAFEQGASPETIQQQYPAMSLELVYGAITYYLAHAASIQHYLRQQDMVWEQWRAKAAARESPVRERLRALERAGKARAQ
jgi:uncharacterized protein (DUF433 family)